MKTVMESVQRPLSLRSALLIFGHQSVISSRGPARPGRVPLAKSLARLSYDDRRPILTYLRMRLNITTHTPFCRSRYQSPSTSPPTEHDRLVLPQNFRSLTSNSESDSEVFPFLPHYSPSHRQPQGLRQAQPWPCVQSCTFSCTSESERQPKTSESRSDAVRLEPVAQCHGIGSQAFKFCCLYASYYWQPPCAVHTMLPVSLQYSTVVRFHPRPRFTPR